MAVRRPQNVVKCFGSLLARKWKTVVSCHMHVCVIRVKLHTVSGTTVCLSPGTHPGHITVLVSHLLASNSGSRKLVKAVIRPGGVCCHRQPARLT